MNTISDWVLIMMDKLGLIGVTLMMFLENVFPPIPSELIMPAAGFAAAKGTMGLVAVIIAGTAGSVLGGLPLYYFGTIFDQKRLLVLTQKYGKYFLVTTNDVVNAQTWFDKYGKSVIFFWTHDSCHSLTYLHSCRYGAYANDTIFGINHPRVCHLDNTFGICWLYLGCKL